MPECSQLSFQLPGLNGRRIEGNFQGGNVSSDGGLMNANWVLSSRENNCYAALGGFCFAACLCMDALPAGSLVATAAAISHLPLVLAKADHRSVL
jgi:hypothetical protein